MLRKNILHAVIPGALSLFLILPIHAKAADYRLIRNDTKMTCVDAQTGAAVTSRFITYKQNTYYFGADGYAHTGWLRLGRDYYFFRSDGTMLKKQWMNHYYFQADGTMARNRWITKDAYVGADGRVIPGYKKRVKARFVNTSQGRKYRNHDGSYSKKIWQCIQGHWYYFYSTGVMARDRQLGSFYVDKRGRMVTNQWIRVGKRKYYYGPDGRLRRTVKIGRPAAQKNAKSKR